jgi:hypothetical protein
MLFEETEQYQDYSFVEALEYLVQKLESRYNSILKINKIMDSSNEPDEIFTLRKDLKLLFNDLEEDFKQGIFAIKALTAQNKQLSENLKLKNKENKNLSEQINDFLAENNNLKLQNIKTKNNEIQIKKDNSKKDINIRKNYDKYENNIEGESGSEEIKNYSIKNNNKKMEQKEIDQFKKNNYEFEKLSNVKNIMDNMKKNKLKLKIAIEQHFTNKSEK